MIETYGVFVFILGMVIGSFLNVVIYRFNSGRGLGGRSMCFTCRRTLSWHELVPIVSYVNQRGRCHGCQSPISMQYPIIEGLTGFVFVSLFMKLTLPFITTSIPPFGVGLFTLIFPLVFFVYMFCLLIVISVYDYHHKIIADKLVWLFNFLALASTVLFSHGVFMVHAPTLAAVLAGPLVALPFFLLYTASRGRALGFGDIKLALGVGWLLGLSAGLGALIISIWIGALVSVFLLIAKGRTYGMKSQIPFGPFLVLATFFVFLFDVTFVDILTKIHF